MNKKLGLFSTNTMLAKYKMNKRAAFFSTDAVLALSIIFLVVIILYPSIRHATYNSETSNDVISTLSSIKIGEMNNSYVSGLIASGDIQNLNQSVLEQIGEFYAKGLPEAQLLSSAVLSQVAGKENFGLWIDDQLVFSSNATPIESAETVWTARQVISGMEKGKEIKGYSSRAFLSINTKKEYFYFGGYVGDGNITALINYNGTIRNAKIEIAINKDFDLYINNIFSGHFQNSSSPISPAVYDISAYLNNFHSGNNEIKLVGNSLYIAGGYIEISHESSQSSPSTKHYFPGIEGMINIYDSFYVPGILNGLDIYLHLNSGYKTFVEIGNITIFSNLTTGEQTFSLTNQQLSTILNYPNMNRKTIPFRIGLENVSYVTNSTKNIDVFSVNDLSGSMGNCEVYQEVPYCTYNCCRADGTGCQGKSCQYTGTCNNQECGACTGNRPLARNYNVTGQQICNKTKLDFAKDSNNIFIDSILNNTQNRIGLKAYSTNYLPASSNSLSNNSVSLKSKVASWTANGNTCICCGINEAKKDLLANSSSGKSRVIVLMSDGDANVLCPEQGTGNAKQDAINASCQAHAANITVYSVGFGSDADPVTMQAIANCGGGSYYFGNVSQIVAIYQQIAQNIIEAAYHEQTIVSNGNISTKLYPDSYINLNYSADILPYGLEITVVTPEFGNYNTTGSFYIPSDSQIIDAKIISYSGPKWTDNVYTLNQTLGWQNIFSLANYGHDYSLLGDPYPVNIPLNYLISGNNSVKITTGLSPDNSSSGSPSDKAIYTIIKPALGYSPISPSALGCIWTIEFEDLTNTTIKIPANYTGTSNCYYTSSILSYNANDAIDSAFVNLLKQLDINSNQMIETKFTEQDLEVSSNEVSGIPYAWSSEVQARTWQ